MFEDSRIDPNERSYMIKRYLEEHDDKKEKEVIIPASDEHCASCDADHVQLLVCESCGAHICGACAYDVPTKQPGITKVLCAECYNKEAPSILRD